MKRYQVRYLIETSPQSNEAEYWEQTIFAVWDNLQNGIVNGTEKHSAQLAQDVADVLNERYESTMERNRKQIFNDTYFVKQ